ncbi:hypothetical protein ABOM_003554, partial [Aspergillus bombycis]
IGRWSVLHHPKHQFNLLTIFTPPGSSINYVLRNEEVTIQDPQSSLKVYEDTNTVSGNHIQVRLSLPTPPPPQILLKLRQVGSPVPPLLCLQLAEHKHSPIITETPSFPGKAIVKASLFDVISQPDKEVFTARRQAWEGPVEGAKQE